MNKEGLLIAFEGGEGAGKSTLIPLLKKHLEKELAVTTYREPGGTQFSEDLRNVFFDHADLSVETSIHVMNAQRQDNMEKIVYPAIDKNDIVIVDRFIASTLIYQGVLNNQYATVDRLIKEYPMITVFVDVPPTVGLKRISDNNRETNYFDTMAIDKHNTIYKGYKSLAQHKPDQYWDIVIDGLKTIDELNLEMKHLAKLLLHVMYTSNNLAEIKAKLRNDYNGMNDRPLKNSYIHYSSSFHNPLSMDSLNLTDSTLDILQNNGITKLSDLMSRTILDIADIPRIGSGKITDITKELARWFGEVSPKPNRQNTQTTIPTVINSNAPLIEQHIQQLKLSTRAENVLLRQKIYTIHNLLHIPADDFNNINGVGTQVYENITHQLERWSAENRMPIKGFPLFK